MPDQNCVNGHTYEYNDTMVDQSRVVLQSLFKQLETVGSAKLQLVSHGAAEGATDKVLAAAVDKDLVYMSAAKTFVRSSGGFSELIAMLVERQKGIQLRAGTVRPTVDEKLYNELLTQTNMIRWLDSCAASMSRLKRCTLSPPPPSPPRFHYFALEL